MSGRETLGVAGVTFTFVLAAFLTLAAWVIGEQHLELGDRFMAVVIGVISVPAATAGITEFITTHWGERP
jgi:small neutral amino acid transporter SnatA (MarC family)